MEAVETRSADSALPPVPGARRPLAGFCLSALAGWLTGFGFHIPVLPVLAICAVLIAFVLLRARSGLASIAVHACALLAAAVHASMTVLPPSAAHLSEQLDRPREFVEVVGTVAGEPIRMDRPGSAEGPWVFALELEGLRRTDPWQRCDGRVEVRWNAPSNAVPPEYGQRRHLAGVVAPRTSRFEAEPFLLQTRGHAELLGVGPHSVFFAWCLEQRKRASAALGRGLPEAEFGPELAMMRALILGERTELDDRVRRAFARTGTLHVVAISGSHVAVFLSLLTAVLKALGRPRTSWILYAAPILILYTVATGMSASAVRACIMAIVFLGAPLFRRRVDAATALAAAALLILAAAPPQLFDPGFLLSFLVVGGLMAFYRAILRFMERWLPGDPWQLDVPRMTKIRRASVRALASLVSASLAAWLVSAPLTAVFFHLSSPVALVANLLVVPLAYFILLGGCLSLAVGTVSAFGAEVFNHATRVFVDMMLWSVDLFAGVPGGYQFVRAPPLVGVFLFYALLLMLFFGTRTIRRNAALAAVVVSAGWGVWHYGNDRAVVLWNGQGRTPVVFLDLPRDRDVLIDTGDSFQSASLVRFLHARGVDRLETLVLARPSAEAMGGAEKLMAEIPVGEVLVPGWPGRSKTFDRFMASCRQKSIPVRPLAVGATGHWAGRVRWEILHPSGRSYTSAERGGLVLHLSRGPGAMLFAGGGGEEAERELLGRSRDLGADVLLTGLRQGSAPWSADLLDAVHPLLRVESAPTFGSLDAPGIVSVPREQVWRAVLPGGQFHSLERMGRAVSSPWNLRADHWWQGSLEPIDR